MGLSAGSVLKHFRMKSFCISSSKESMVLWIDSSVTKHNPEMVVIRGLLRERQFISAPIKIICPRRSRGLMIILPASRSRDKNLFFHHVYDKISYLPDINRSNFRAFKRSSQRFENASDTHIS